MFPDLNKLTHLYHHRTYAITWKNKWAAGIMYAVVAIQFGIGLYVSIYIAENKGQYLYH